MLPWQILARTNTPDGDELVLRQRGDEYTIRVGNSELMSSRAHLSEDTLGAHGAGAVAKRSTPRVLIGGLGMGFTLRAALDALPADELTFLS